ncbi:single-stranded DNA-binding protein [compost metagenome]
MPRFGGTLTMLDGRGGGDAGAGAGAGADDYGSAGSEPAEAPRGGGSARGKPPGGDLDDDIPF